MLINVRAFCSNGSSDTTSFGGGFLFIYVLPSHSSLVRFSLCVVSCLLSFPISYISFLLWPILSNFLLCHFLSFFSLPSSFPFSTFPYFIIYVSLCYLAPFCSSLTHPVPLPLPTGSPPHTPSDHPPSYSVFSYFSSSVFSFFACGHSFTTFNFHSYSSFFVYSSAVYFTPSTSSYSASLLFL